MKFQLTKRENIGEGSYGYVYLATDISDNKYAIKCFKKHSCNDLDEDIVIEVSCLGLLKHSNIMELLDFYSFKDTYRIVMPYYKSSLSDQIKYCSDDDVIMKLITQIVNGIDYLHSNGIVHTDLKPTNIVMNSVDDIRIIDLGCARYIGILPNTHKSSEVQTLNYRAPEILLGSKTFDYKIDIWSVGCILIELITGQIAFNGDSELDQLHKYFKQFGTPNEKDWPEAHTLPYWRVNFLQWDKKDLLPRSIFKGVLTGMLTMNPANRFTSQQVLNSLSVSNQCDKDYYRDKNYKSLIEHEYQPIDINLSTNDRCKLNTVISWAIEIYKYYKLRTNTLFLSLQIFYRYISTKLSTGQTLDMFKSKLQLYLVGSISLANKIHEVHTVYISEFAYITDNTYSIEEIRNIQSEILIALDCKIIQSTIIEFIDSNSYDKVYQDLIKVISISTLFNQVYFKYRPSVLADAIIKITQKAEDTAIMPGIIADIIPDILTDIRSCLQGIKDSKDFDEIKKDKSWSAIVTY